MNKMQALATSGIQAHSGSSWYNRYVIFAVDGGKVREQAFKAWMLNRGFGFKELVGSYNNETETAFIVNATVWDTGDLDWWVRNQESFLVLEKGKYHGGGIWTRPCKLVFSNGGEGSLMSWREVTKDYALAQDSWTYDPSQNKYFHAS